MGFASYFEDVSLRAAENGFDAGTARPSVGTSPDNRPVDSDDTATAIRRRPKTIHLCGEEARRFILVHLGGAKEFAYLQVVETSTGRLVREFPYRQRAEVEACLARVEVEHPGALRLVIVKRLELPEQRVQS
jgi:hypothetical protein